MCVCVYVYVHIYTYLYVWYIYIYIHSCRLASRLVCIFCHKYRSLSMFATHLLLSKLLFQGRFCFSRFGIWEPMTTFNFGLWVRYPSCLERVWTTICIWVQGRIYPSSFGGSKKGVIADLLPSILVSYRVRFPSCFFFLFNIKSSGWCGNWNPTGQKLPWQRRRLYAR